jgi:hypothetical protein
MSLNRRNIIVSQYSGTEHLVGDVGEDDLAEDEDGKLTHYYAWTDCGIAVTGKLVRTKTKPRAKACRRCFRR